MEFLERKSTPALPALTTCASLVLASADDAITTTNDPTATFKNLKQCLNQLPYNKGRKETEREEKEVEKGKKQMEEEISLKSRYRKR